MNDLALSLKDLQRTDTELYLVGACSIHAIQKPLENGIIAAFGDSGIDKRTMLQLLYVCYHMQQLLAGKLFRKTWELVNPGVSVPDNGLFDDNGLALYDGDEDMTLSPLAGN